MGGCYEGRVYVNSMMGCVYRRTEVILVRTERTMKLRLDSMQVGNEVL